MGGQHSGRKNSLSKSRDKKECGRGVTESEAAKLSSSLISENNFFRFEFEILSLGNDWPGVGGNNVMGFVYKDLSGYIVPSFQKALLPPSPAQGLVTCA